MAERRSLFETFQSENDTQNVIEESDVSDGEFNYVFPDNEDLPSPCDSDEEYVLTELGPVSIPIPAAADDEGKFMLFYFLSFSLFLLRHE